MSRPRLDLPCSPRWAGCSANGRANHASTRTNSRVAFRRTRRGRAACGGCRRRASRRSRTGSFDHRLRARARARAPRRSSSVAGIGECVHVKWPPARRRSGRRRRRSRTGAGAARARARRAERVGALEPVEQRPAVDEPGLAAARRGAPAHHDLQAGRRAEEVLAVGVERRERRVDANDAAAAIGRIGWRSTISRPLPTSSSTNATARRGSRAGRRKDRVAVRAEAVASAASTATRTPRVAQAMSTRRSARAGTGTARRAARRAGPRSTAPAHSWNTAGVGVEGVGAHHAAQHVVAAAAHAVDQRRHAGRRRTSAHGLTKKCGSPGGCGVKYFVRYSSAPGCAGHVCAEPAPTSVCTALA